MEKQYLLSNEEYQAVKVAWRQIALTKTIKPRKVIMYNILRGKPPTCGFTETKNILRIKGNDRWFVYNDALTQMQYFYGKHYDYLAKHNTTKAEEVERQFLETYGILLSAKICRALEQYGKQ